jgi:hypothetical protein
VASIISQVTRYASDHVVTRQRSSRRAASSRRFTRVVLLGILQVLFLPATDLRAEVLVRGNPRALEVVARDASIAEVLSALNTNFGLRYRGVVPEQRRVTGTHVGSLREVLKWLLKGCDFVLMTKSGTTNVIVMSVTEATQTAAPQR